MSEDPVIKEVHRVKAEIARKYGYDIRAIAQAAREICREKGYKTTIRPQKRVTLR